MERALSEFLVTARRAGLAVSPAEAIDALRVLVAVGLQDKPTLKFALSQVLAKRRSDRELFAEVFDAYFGARGASHANLYERLRAQGFQDAELDELRAVIEATARATATGLVWSAVVAGESAMGRLLDLAGARVDLRPAEDPARVGVVAMRLLEAANVPRAQTSLSVLRSRLRDALGERGDLLTDALSDELVSLRSRARTHVTALHRRPRQVGSLERVPFAQLDPDQVARVERETARLSERLLGRAMVRARHARRGRLDVRGTLRAALATGGVPMRPVMRGKAPRRTKLVVLCDVSDSVRHSARFTLLFVHAAQRLFQQCRSFMFVSEVAESTEIFRRETAARAIALTSLGEVVNVADNSHYAHALGSFAQRYADALDARTTLLILGDARTHHFEAGERHLQHLSERVARVLWFHPEPETAWHGADSAMPRYLPFVDRAFAVYDLDSLRRAVRGLSA